VSTYRWYVCHDCGWEHQMCAMYQQCGDCRSGNLHIHSNIDGELPKRLPRHSSGCSNQNVIDPAGAYRGAEECGCVVSP
jgi:hypothetical protein